MSVLFWLTGKQMRRIEPYFPALVDDKRVLSGNFVVVRNGLRWRAAPADYGSHKTTDDRFIRRSWLGVFNHIFAALSAKGPRPERLMIDATHLKAHRTDVGLLKRGCSST